MSEQNVYQLNGSTDSITFYSSTQYGPPVGVDLNTGEQQVGNQIASENIRGPIDLLDQINQAGYNSGVKIREYVQNWFQEASQAVENFRQAEIRDAEKIIGQLNKNVETVKKIGREVGNVGSAVIGTGKGVAKLIDLSFSSPNPDPKQVKRAMDEIYGGGNVQRGIQNQNKIADTLGIRRNTAQSNFGNPLGSLENTFNRQYERVTTGYESDIINRWQNPTLEPGWKSNDPYDPTSRKLRAGTLNLSGAKRVKVPGGYIPYQGSEVQRRYESSAPSYYPKYNIPSASGTLFTR